MSRGNSFKYRDLISIARLESTSSNPMGFAFGHAIRAFSRAHAFISRVDRRVNVCRNVVVARVRSAAVNLRGNVVGLTAGS